VARYVESVLDKKGHVKNYATNVGKGNPRIYYNVVQKNEAANYAEVFVQLQNMKLPEIERFVDDLRGDFTDFPNATIQVRQFEQGPPVDAPVAIRVFGENLDSLRALAFRVEKVLKGTPGTIYVENPLTALKTDLQVRINKDKAAMLGVPIVDIDRTVRMGIAGLPAGTYRENNGDEYTINVSLPRGPRPTLAAFDQMYVAAMSGALVPLRQLATVELSPLAHHHPPLRQGPLRDRNGFVRNGYLTDNVTQDVISRLDKMKFRKATVTCRPANSKAARSRSAAWARSSS
jgi:multidrug efflux pump subunit AcrB